MTSDVDALDAIFDGDPTHDDRLPGPVRVLVILLLAAFGWAVVFAIAGGIAYALGRRP